MPKVPALNTPFASTERRYPALAAGGWLVSCRDGRRKKVTSKKQANGGQIWEEQSRSSRNSRKLAGNFVETFAFVLSVVALWLGNSYF